MAKPSVAILGLLILFNLFGCAIFRTGAQTLPRFVKSTNINTYDGVLSNGIMSMVQDKQGFVWLGTSDGLCRYDGKKFRTYNEFIKIYAGTNAISVLTVDSRGFIWIGTLGGLYKFDPRTCKFQSFVHEKSDHHSLSQNLVESIYEDDFGVIWVGTRNGLNKLVDVNKNRFERYLFNTGSRAGSRNTLISGITQDKQHSIWVSTNVGLINISRDGEVRNTYTHLENGKQRPELNSLTCLLNDNDMIWVGSRSGVVKKFDIKSKVFSNVTLPESGNWSSNNEIRCIKKDKRGSIWIGSYKGIYNINPQTNEAFQYLNIPNDRQSISDNTILSLMDDKDGAIWVGTYTSGVDVLRKSNREFKILNASGSSTGLSYNIVNAVTVDRSDNLWIGTGGGGIDFRPHGSQTFKRYNEKTVGPQFGSDQVSCVTQTSDGRIWAGMHLGGISVFDPITQKWKPYRNFDPDTSSVKSESVFHILEDSRKRVWVSMSNGLYRLNPNNGRADRIYLKNKTERFPVQSVFEDSNHNLWVSSITGIYMLKNGGVRFEPVPVDIASPKVSQIEISTYCVMEDGKGNIWAGTNVDGLLKYNASRGRFYQFFISELYPNRAITGMQIDKAGRLWLTSKNKLMLLKEKQDGVIVFEKSDMMFENEFCWNASGKGHNDGMLYFGTAKGLLYFNSADIVINEKVPKIVFTDLVVQNINIEPGDSTGILRNDLSVTNEIILSYEDNFIKIGFASLNYIQPEKSKFAYFLRGTKDQWHYTDDPSVTFNNLAPGNYTLLVKGSNNDNVWSEHPISLKITVLQPLWKRWWALALYALIIFGTIYLVARFLFARREIQRSQEIQQSKLDFFTNVSHEIRTHLSLISGPVDKLVTIYTADDEVRNYLTIVQNNANRLVGLVTELLDFRKIDDKQIVLAVNQHDLVFFTKNILSVFEYLRQQKNISLVLTCNKDNIPAWFDHFQLEKVFYNLISNAFKFIDGGTQIEIRIEEGENDILVKIIDDGRGIKEDSLDKIFTNYFQVYDYGDQNTGYGLGLALSKKIVELHHGTIQAASSSAMDSPAQTIFTITLLKGKKHFENDNIVWSNQVLRSNLEVYEREIKLEYEDEAYDQVANEKHCILIVEDNPELRKFLTQCLGEVYHVIECSDGSQGWDKAVEVIPDIVVSDIMMGEVSGLDLCRKLKADERTSHIPVILLTAMASKDNRMAGLMHEADHYITKPFDIRELELIIANLLNLRQAIHARLGSAISEPGETVYKSAGREEAFLLKLTDIIEENLRDESFGVIQLSRSIGISRPVLYRKVKALTGMSIVEFSKSLRLKKAAEMLSNDSHNITEISELAGFNDRRYFTREFRKVYGKSPSEYARGKRSDL